ncbi:MAG: hypothetical protein MR659_00225 [Mollicutes bacterium]|nr:hypothetical protein [Mollicutes bacterium]MDY3904247.1 hypothetical protein [Candidatus Enteromonas sp.]
MRKNEFDDYLVRGWECGGNLFYNRRVYFSECGYIAETNKFRLNAFSFKAEKYDDNHYSRYVDSKGNYVDLIEHIDMIFDTREEAKEYYLSAKIFDGKSFWEIGMKFEWLEYDGPDIPIDK